MHSNFSVLLLHMLTLQRDWTKTWLEFSQQSATILSIAPVYRNGQIRHVRLVQSIFSF